MNRDRLCDEIVAALDLPLAILALISFILIIVDLAVYVPPNFRLWVAIIFWFTWSTFLLEYAVKLALTKDKIKYIKTHWTQLLLLVVPFLRVFLLFRAARVTQGIAAIRLLLFSHVHLSGLGIALVDRILNLSIVTGVVILVGAMGGFIFESRAPGTRMSTFGDALWWSAALTTTVASEKYPVTTGGRILAFFLMVYSMIVFTYLTASIAAFFIGTETERHD
jgi:voltage-gated potassium channel